MENKTKEVKKIKNPFFVVIALLLASVLVFGIVLGIIGFIRDINSVMVYENVYVGRGVVNYLISTFKPGYVNALRWQYADRYDVEDSREFWSTPHPDGEGKSFGEVLCEDADSYVREQIVGAYLFDYATNDGSSSSKELKKQVDEFIEKNAREVLDFDAGGDEGAFNEKAKDMGFTYSDFVEASRLMYKCSFARIALFGEEGEPLRNNAYYREAAQFYADNYTRVKLLLIRTESDVVYNDGEPMRDEKNNYVYKELNEGEIAARLEVAEDIRAAISAYKNGTTGQISETYFDAKIEQFNSYYSYKSGYYFSESSEAAAEFKGRVGEEVCNAALALTDDEPYGEVAVDGVGIYFLCKCSLEEAAFVNVERDDFFSDFYSDFADYKYLELLDEGADGVRVKDEYYAIDATALPMNIDFKIQE